MAPESFAQLPDHISLSRDEVAMILLGLDTVDEAGLDADEAAKVKRAIRLLTTKLR